MKAYQPSKKKENKDYRKYYFLEETEKNTQRKSSVETMISLLLMVTPQEKALTL